MTSTRPTAKTACLRTTTEGTPTRENRSSRDKSATNAERRARIFVQHMSSSVKPPSRHRTVLLTWLGIWPIITLVLWLLLPLLLPRLPLPLITLLVTAIVVPVMGYCVMPFLHRHFDGWLRR